MKHALLVLLFAAACIAPGHSAPDSVQMESRFYGDSFSLAQGFEAAFSEMHSTNVIVLFRRGTGSWMLSGVKSIQARGGVVLVRYSSVTVALNPNDIIAVSTAPLPQPSHG